MPYVCIPNNFLNVSLVKVTNHNPVNDSAGIEHSV